MMTKKQAADQEADWNKFSKIKMIKTSRKSFERSTMYGYRKTFVAATFLYFVVGYSFVLGSSIAQGSTSTHLNSGVNCTYILLRLFDIDLPLADLRERLLEDSELSKPCSLAAVQQVCLENRLEAEAIDTTEVSKQISELPSGYVAIVREMYAHRNNEFRFVLVSRTSSDQFCLIDAFAAQEIVKVSRGDLRATLSDATGQLLLLHKEPLLQGTHIRLLKSEVNVGYLSTASQPPVAEFYLLNDGTTPTQIKDIKRSCGCLGDPIFREVIGPGQAGRIAMSLDPRALGPGDGSRQFLVDVGGLSRSPIVGTIRYQKDGATTLPTASEFTVTPATINFGKIRSGDLSSQTWEAILAIPSDYVSYGESPRILIHCDSPEIQIDVDHDDRVPMSSSVVRYTIHNHLESLRGDISIPISFSLWNKRLNAYDIRRVNIIGNIY